VPDRAGGIRSTGRLKPAPAWERKVRIRSIPGFPVD
jgi:hypothetical protein